ncbi:hypothetical protein PAMC26510_23345 [Caballeronia sordidicola]|uniref:Uncharacterized protein n=1 Tax=Caballeronia sordidicola TaxID=196367 RepID=A0A242MJ64_CABSO|nr:hypothetical protein PAMC26510_23345 [Caballeronia sordidicola]
MSIRLLKGNDMIGFSSFFFHDMDERTVMREADKKLRRLEARRRRS